MLANIKIGTRLILGFCIILLFLVAISIAGYWGTHLLEKEVTDVISREALLSHSF